MSDTGEEFPEPITVKQALYQDVGQLPCPLAKHHFVEGLVYFMTAHSQKKISTLGMVIEAQDKIFVFREFFVKGSSRKTFHETENDKRYEYNDVWRLAPRRESTRKICINEINVGQCIRFEDNAGMTTAVVTKIKSRTITVRVECGSNRGKIIEVEKLEIVNCSEIIASSILADLRKKILNSKWEECDSSRTPDTPLKKPKLKEDFWCPEPVKHKRI